MGRLLSGVFNTLRRYVVLFVAILLVLACGGWVRTEWQNIHGMIGELPSLQTAEADVQAYQLMLTRRAEEELKNLSGATVRQLDARISVVDREIVRLQKEQHSAPSMLVALRGSGALAESLAQTARIKSELVLRAREKEYLVALRTYVDTLTNRQNAVAKLAQLHAAHIQAYSTYESARKRRDAFTSNAGLSAKIFFTDAYKELEALDQEVQSRRAVTDAANKNYIEQRARIARLPAFTAPPVFHGYQQELAAVSAPLRDKLLQARELAARNHVWRAYEALRPLFPIAFGVLAGGLLGTLAIRAVFYYILAPLAARRPPIVIGTAGRHTPVTSPPQRRGAGDDSRISAVSQELVLTPGHELIIRPAYCQSQPMGVSAKTRPLFDGRHWLTSIAAHLWMLKQLRTRQEAVIVVSPTVDALEEIALLEIAAGDAFVLQPRGLVGIMHRTGERPRIRSHWRLGTLHAWFTLQLRYLSFEGPATLIVKGCRGVRLGNAATGRTISQDATLGFSTGVNYATIRAEPFFPYLTGSQPLLLDRFTGEHGCYLYEEVPHSVQPGRSRHDPLEVLFDAGLKAFGI